MLNYIYLLLIIQYSNSFLIIKNNSKIRHMLVLTPEDFPIPEELNETKKVNVLPKNASFVFFKKHLDEKISGHDLREIINEDEKITKEQLEKNQKKIELLSVLESQTTSVHRKMQLIKKYDLFEKYTSSFTPKIMDLMEDFYNDGFNEII